MANGDEKNVSGRDDIDLEDDELAEDQEDDEIGEAQPQGLRGEEELDQIFSERSVSVEELEEEKAPEKAPVQARNRGRVTDSSALLQGEVLDRAMRANERLRAQLKGTIAVDIKDKREQFLFDGRGDKPSLQPLKESTDAPQADCVTHIDQKDLFRIWEGNLNPQVAMLSHKLRVDGKLSLAVYFFNLVSPD